MVIIRNRIRVARERAGMTARELADRAGMVAPSVSRVEHVEVSPRAKTLQRIADALGVPIRELLP